MTRRPRAIARSGPASAAKRWVTLLALLGFFLQSMAVQTHVHSLDLAPVAKLAATHTAPVAPSKTQDPVDQCRLCQEIVHAGSFITPSAVAILTGLDGSLAIFHRLTPGKSDPASAFAWQSRAPPR